MIALAGAAWVAWAALVTSVEVIAVSRALARRRRPRTHDAEAIRGARVLVVRPCAGDKAWLRRSLGSVASARRSFSMSTRMAVASSTDGALGVAEAAARDLAARGADASVVLTDARGPNRKAGQLATVIAREPPSFDVVIVADSDVDLEGADLDALVGPLLSGGSVAAVWSPPVEVGPAKTLGDRASMAVLAGSLHAFPLLSCIDGLGLVGKLFAVRRDALEAVGGFGALVSYLGEDVELARRLRAAGLRVATAPAVARSLANGRSWHEVEARFARWIMVIRAQRAALVPAYPLLFFATVPLALGGVVVLAAVPPLGALVAASVVAARLVVGMASARCAGRPVSIGGAVVDAILADALMAAAFARAFRSRQVAWGDATLTIDGAGRLCDDGDASLRSEPAA